MAIYIIQYNTLNGLFFWCYVYYHKICQLVRYFIVQLP